MRKRDYQFTTRPIPYLSLAAAIDSVLNSAKIRSQIFVSVIAQDWEEIVGPVIVNHVQPISLLGGKLTLQADSSVWRQQVSFMKQELIDKINIRLGHLKIRDIRIR